MSIFPITPLVHQVQRLMVETFDVSEPAALDYAAELVSLAEGWGSPEAAAQLDWSYRIRKDLGETRKLRWRSEEERKLFEAAERQKYDAWDAFIRGRRHV
jgi:hypothetical protein